MLQKRFGPQRLNPQVEFSRVLQAKEVALLLVTGNRTGRKFHNVGQLAHTLVSFSSSMLQSRNLKIQPTKMMGMLV
jgi:hypothetical protein